jgi:hypothetical protein
LHNGVDNPEFSGRIVQLFERGDDDCTGQDNDKGRENVSDSQLGADSHLLAPNPDKPVGVKRKSRFIGEPNRKYKLRKHESSKTRKMTETISSFPDLAASR